MSSSIIEKIYKDLKKTGRYTIPKELFPPENGYHIIAWVKELFLYYAEEGIIARALDDLPPIKLSAQPGLDITLQDVHKFIIGEQNLIPLERKREIVKIASDSSSSKEAWQRISPILLHPLHNLDRNAVQEELSWRFSPVGETLWVLTWFFLEREAAKPPSPIWMVCHRFPYYKWTIQGEEGQNQQAMWEPDNPFCRWEWLSCDLFYQWLKLRKLN